MPPDAPRVRIAEIPRGEPLSTHPEGRRCRECGARLSIYNSKQVCRPCAHREALGTTPLTAGEVRKKMGL